MTSSSKHLTADKIVDEIKKCGVTHIVWLADGVASFMYQSMIPQKDLTLVPVCRECEAFALFDRLYPLKTIRYYLKRRWGRNVTNTIRRYYYDWKLQPGNENFDL